MDEENTLCFRVALEADKRTIRAAFNLIYNGGKKGEEQLYKVRKVNTLIT
jgi:ribosomal protein L23